MSDRPDGDEVERLLTHRLEQWQDAHSNFEKVDSFYNGTNELWDDLLRKSRPQSRGMKARQIVDHAVNAVTASKPKIHRPPAGEGEGHQAKADKVEPFLEAVFEAASLAEAALPWKALAKNVIGYGYGVIEGPMAESRRMVPKPEKADGESAEDFELRESAWEYNRRSISPVTLRAPNPTTVLLDPWEKRPADAIVLKKMEARQLETLSMKKVKTRKYAQRYEAKKEERFKLIDYVEYWDPPWHLVKVKGGETLWVERYTWGYVPFAHAYSGFGMQPSGQEANPANLAQGILHGVFDALKRFDQSKSALHNALINAGFPPFGATKSQAEIVAALAVGGVLPEGVKQEDVWWMQFPEFQAWMFKAVELIEAEIEQATFSQQLAGFNPENVRTLGQELSRSQLAHRKFEAVGAQLNHLASIWASNVLRLIDVMGERVTVGGETIGSEEIEHSYAVDVKFEMVDSLLRLQEQQMAMQEFDKGLGSPEDYWRVAGEEDATGRRERIAMHRLRQHPYYMNMMMADLAKKDGMTVLTEQFKAEAKKALEVLTAQPVPAGMVAGTQGLQGQPVTVPNA